MITGAMARLGEAHAGVDMAGAGQLNMCVHAMGNSSLRRTRDKVVVLNESPSPLRDWRP